MHTIQISALSLLLVACGGEDATPPARTGSAATAASVPAAAGSQQPVSGSQAEGEQGPSNPLGFEVWYADFPFDPHLSPRKPGAFYDRTRKQALDKVVSNLQGNCSQKAWNFSREFAARFPIDDLELLVEAMERNFAVAHKKDAVENTIGAMGQAKNPYFGSALLRALEHRNESIKTAAMKALVYCGTAETVREAYKHFELVEVLAKRAWIQAAGNHLGEEVVQAYSALLQSRNPIHRTLAPFVFDEAKVLPIDLAYQILKPLWANPTPQLRAQLAGILHRHGDGSGTAALKVMLDEGSPQTKVAAIRALGPELSSREVFLERLLVLTTDPAGDVQMEALRALRDLPGERIDSQIEVMSVEATGSLKNEVLKVLCERGVRDVLDGIIAEIATATGTRLSLLMNQLVAAHDGTAVAAIEARMRKEPKKDWKGYLQIISHTTTKEAFAPLRRIVEEDSFQLDASQDSSWRYVCLLMVNARGAEAEAMAFCRNLPKDDYVRRAYMMFTVACIAADRDDQELSKEVYDLLRSVLIDRSEIPQLRLLALEYLRRDIRIEDARKIKRMVAKESLAMRVAFNDFLFEFF